MKKILLTAFAALVLSASASAASLISISGKITADGKPVAGVPVTDGTQFVVTDKSGKYTMSSAEGTKYVYITLPDGYNVPVKDGVPVLYADVTPDSKGRFSHDFTLEKAERDMTKHVIFVQADPQVYFDPNLDEVEKASLEMKNILANEYPGQEGFGLILGDVIGQFKQGDKYFPWMIKNIAASDFPNFYVCGNHDIEMDAPTNEQSRKAFNHYFGPTYYSFNRGKVHYVVLDNVYWMGRYYAGYYTQQQLDWLKQDLALVPEESTVIISQHIPCYSRQARRQEWGKESYHKVVSNRQELFNILKPYNAHIFSGHEHYSENYILGDKLYEHCHAPLSDLFWCTHWAMDGTPNGYYVYEVDGDNLNWYYKVLGRDKNYQFELYPGGRSRQHPEAVVANIWNVDKTWKIEWFEDGQLKGEMIQFTGEDPNLWDDVVANGKNYPFPYMGCDITEHLFYAVPENENSIITVKATDHNGNVYTQTLDQKDHKTDEK